MITPRDIAKKSMTPEKIKIAKNDFFAFYIGRPITYVLTVPFLYTNITPNAVSLLSIIPILAGFVLMYFACTQSMMVVAWALFFLWSLLDGVDGNIARYKKMTSPLGSVYDAMGGYIAMVLEFFGWGVVAAHNGGILSEYISIDPDIYIILGAVSGIAQIFPRFIMHKVVTTLGDEKKVSGVKDKSGYSPLKVVALNLISIAGFLQVIMLVAVLLNMLDLFTIGYFFLNTAVMLVSLRYIFKSARASELDN